jgi:hypothetical protein
MDSFSGNAVPSSIRNYAYHVMVSENVISNEFSWTRSVGLVVASEVARP